MSGVEAVELSMSFNDLLIILDDYFEDRGEPAPTSQRMRWREDGSWFLIESICRCRLLGLAEGVRRLSTRQHPLPPPGRG